MRRSFYSEITETYRNYLDEGHWLYVHDEWEGNFHFNMKINDSKLKMLQYVICVRDNDCMVCAISPVSVDAKDPEQLQQMEEFVCRANLGLRNGNFDMNVDDGEIRYKLYVNCDKGAPGMETMRRSIYLTVAVYEKYSSGILQIAVNNLSARDAIEMCKGNTSVSKGVR